MPSQYDLPVYSQAGSIEDVNKYNKLDFYFATMQAKLFPIWSTYNKLYGKIPWTANQGPIMKGVEAVMPPVGRQFFYPNPVTQQANKDVIEMRERTEQCYVQRHKFESRLFSFLPAFQDFRANQIDPNIEAITAQMAVAGDDMFIRSVMLAKSPFLFIVGNKAPDATAYNPELCSVPTVPSGTPITAASTPKNAAFWMAQIAKVGKDGLPLSAISRMIMTMREDLRAPFFEAAQNVPKDNEIIKGKYVFTGAMNEFEMFMWDADLAKFKSLNWNIYEDGFYGSPFQTLTYKPERYPLYLKADGTFPVPELTNDNGDTIPNPDYTNPDVSPYAIGFIHGADGYKTLKVGPPPKAFAGKGMSVDQFNGMNWNGEVQLTRNVVVAYQDVDGNTIYDTNKYGEYLQLISSLTMGCLPVRARNAIPVLYKRTRPITA